MLAIAIAAVALSAAPFCVMATTHEDAVFVKIFERRYQTAKTLQATFLERYTENGAIVRSEAGTAYFRRPGKMRWEYEAPEKDLFLVDGKTAWFYVPADRTATRVPAKQSGDWRTPLALLAGEMKVSRVCARVEQAPNEKSLSADNVVLRCRVRGASAKEDTAPGSAGKSKDDAGAPAGATPDSSASPAGAQNDIVLFEINRHSGELARLVARQSGGVEVEFRFENWHLDPPLPDSMFKFDPPPGVAIVNGELPQGDDPMK
jgi:chaperone LolA